MSKPNNKPSSSHELSVRAKGAMEMQNSFGFKSVNPEEKQERVNNVFHSVANKYDLMNDIMSLGMHRLWKDIFITKLRPHKTISWRQLDVAGGTGDIAFAALKATKGNEQAHITVLDINSSMLEVGKKRARDLSLLRYIDFVEGDAQKLPFENNSFDAYTISFGIRNVPHIDKALEEAYRVLKPGGRFLCLEFSKVEQPILEKLYDFWSFNAIPLIGQLVAGDHDSYQYLVESIRKFPAQDDFELMIKQAGFKQTKYTNLTGGIATIFEARKI